MTEQQQQKWVATGDRAFRISPFEYMDDIAHQINARPHIWRHWKIVRMLLLGPLVASQYRLDGPNQWEGAESQIQKVSQRESVQYHRVKSQHR